MCVDKTKPAQARVYVCSVCIARHFTDGVFETFARRGQLVATDEAVKRVFCPTSRCVPAMMALACALCFTCDALSNDAEQPSLLYTHSVPEAPPSFAAASA